jgi:hypothetical protein
MREGTEENQVKLILDNILLCRPIDMQRLRREQRDDGRG